jgi:hypothetical protein
MQRYAVWRVDDQLKESFEEYVRAQYHRTEILSFVSRDFPQYTWSLRSLDRRLPHFDIFYTDYNVDYNVDYNAEICYGTNRQVSKPQYMYSSSSYSNSAR